MSVYDMVIIGGGPCGLTLAQCCSRAGAKVAVLEAESTLGGCHRVRRVSARHSVQNKQEFVFTEHGPRVYSSSYVVFRMILEDLGLNFFDLFSRYNFTITEINNQTVWTTLGWGELFSLTMAFLKILIQPGFGRDISVYDFMTSNEFSQQSIELLDRICRLTDGATSKDYTLYQFLQLFNQQAFYPLYQPRSPNDKSLFSKWRSVLESRGVEFLLDHQVDKLVTTTSTSTNELLISHCVTTNGKRIYGKRFVLAVPPKPMMQILKNSDAIVRNTFGDYQRLNEWAIATAYIDYVSVTFHWDTKLDLGHVYGFPKTEWGIAFIVLTDYMTFDETSSKTVISAAITISDIASRTSGLLPDQCDGTRLLQEILTQLRVSFPNLPEPTHSIISPGVEFNTIEKKWRSRDTAFIATSRQPFLEPTPAAQSPILNLFNVGTHNGKHLYSFTSIEAAVTNAVSLSHTLYPEIQDKYVIKRGVHLSDTMVVGFIALIIYLYFIYRKPNNVFRE